MTLTSFQQAAIAARGNVLVVAGAGTGKTRTLVERCLYCLVNEKPRASIDEMLIVTFTDAAAAEVRERIRHSIEREAEKNPAEFHWAEQLALFETAHIGTLHGFCFRLVREHFYKLELDPQVSILSAEEAALRERDALDTVMLRHYTEKTPDAEAVQKLIQVQGGGSDQSIRKLVLQIHNYTQTLPDPKRWFEKQLEVFASPTPIRWEAWLVEGAWTWAKEWLEEFAVSDGLDPLLAACVAELEGVSATTSRSEFAAILAEISVIEANPPKGKKSDALKKKLAQFFEEAAFLDSLAGIRSEHDPLIEDWNWVRDQMIALIGLACEFGKEFADAKRERGLLDFHDLEQCALRLLWDNVSEKPTTIAEQWRDKLKFVFVDEYQDINAAQDKIISSLSRDDARANRFLVGDVKQSIYRFRLADPSIFRGYMTKWKSPVGKNIPLSDNFRSRETLLVFVNSLFGELMGEKVGGVIYDEDAALRFGEAVEREPLRLAADPSPRVELHLKIKTKADETNAGDEGTLSSRTVADLLDTEKEARLVASRLSGLKDETHQIWDDEKKTFRAVEWRDMAILLRAPSGKAEAYAKEFQRANIPLIVARSGFYESLEVMDLLNLLRVLDNPLQDLPVLAVLRSPLAGLTLDELAQIRLALRKGHFWHAVQTFHRGEKNTETNLLSQKIELFLARFRKWRKFARQSSLSRCLEAVLSETFYVSWLLTQPRGAQRVANLQRFLGLAQQFDQFQRQGLFRFLRFVEAQQLAEVEPDLPAVVTEDAVQLMSIHQSKGLEFPVVVIADLGKGFNFSDLHKDIILDEEFGLCPQICPPHTARTYPSLPYWLARRRQKRELLGEELRLLYVAATRARDTLILTGTMTANKFNKWIQPRAITSASLLEGRTPLDWLGLWLAKISSINPTERNGANIFLRWSLHAEIEGISAEPEKISSGERNFFETDDWKNVQERLAWEYDHQAATTESSKSSVSILRRRYADEQELAVPFRAFQKRRMATPLSGKPAELSTSDRGTAHHLFLQFVSLESTGNVQELKQEASRLEHDGILNAGQIAALDFSALAVFWQSELGVRVRANEINVRRELAFTSRFSPNELANLIGEELDASLNEEFVVVQGVADVAVILPKEIWLIDFKTDRFDTAQLREKIEYYEPQLYIYATALEQIYKKPVTEIWLHFLSLQRSERLAGK